MNINRELWGAAEGREIYLFTLYNNEVELTVSNLGCTIHSIIISGKKTGKRNIVLGYDSLIASREDRHYMGCLVGRYAGRIANASFILNKVSYQLAANEPSGNHLHGGNKGFNKKVFNISSYGTTNETAFVRFHGTSGNMEEGYPGAVQIEIVVSLNDNNEISITYEAETDSETHINLTHHHYFNLCGPGAPGTAQHLQINANAYLDQDENYIPTGKINAVGGTSYDFTSPRSVDDGFNHCYVLNDNRRAGYDALLSDPGSGLKMYIVTSYPGMIFYSGDFLDKPFRQSQGICLETQFFPDTPNNPGFPSTVAVPGKKYHQETRMILANIN